MQTNTSLKITVIDDDTQMRAMLEDFIKEKYPHAELTTHATGEDAIQNISAGQDLVVLDYNLDSIHKGGMNGIQVLKKLNEKFPGVPVIIISAQEKSEVAANTMKHGARDYIIKNENTFHRLEIALKNILGQIKVKKDNAKQKILTRVLIVLAVASLLAILLWKNVG